MSKITKLEQGKRNKERVNVYLDEDFAFAMELELVYKMGLTTGMEIDEEEVKKIAHKEGFTKCKEKAIKIIERSYKTEKEMRTRLKEKEFDEEQIDYAIDFLLEYNFINDEKYTKMYVKDKLLSQGKNKIKYALLRKGVNANIIEEALAECDNDEEFERGLVLCEKKYNLLVGKEKDKYKLKDKLFRYLVGRGYDFSITKEIINRVINKEEY
ncbi:recombination regulator RecX [uncultured Clostridium sp.]|uniref:recombination regulator RecX n=1 Tax=uncultured Clostridium sp. TaxID=59620 RepID=UPI002601D70A|nr:recombination regulator RecX [uncultured Clostridium sp.]